jgi:hypothetical protein
MNPVALGLMFREMKEGRDLSQRALAEVIGTSEGTVRNALTYLKAFEVRNRYAPDEARATIARLTVQQVRAYLDLPARQRDQWLDDGADLDSARRSTRAAASAKQKDNVGSGERTEASPTSERQEAKEQQAAEVATADREGHAPDRPAGEPDGERPAPPQVGRDESQVQLEQLQDAWDQAGETARRDFLAALLERAEVAALIRQLLA